METLANWDGEWTNANHSLLLVGPTTSSCFDVDVVGVGAAAGRDEVFNNPLLLLDHSLAASDHSDLSFEYGLMGRPPPLPRYLSNTSNSAADYFPHQLPPTVSGPIFNTNVIMKKRKRVWNPDPDPDHPKHFTLVGSEYPAASSGRFKLIRETKATEEATAHNISFQQQGGQGGSAAGAEEGDVDAEAIQQMKEMIYRAAALRPVNLGEDPEAGVKPRRKNVKISSDPQTVAARQRREKISERLRVLQKLVPGGCKMDTASMLDEAANYLKFLRAQIKALQAMPEGSSASSAAANRMVPSVSNFNLANYYGISGMLSYKNDHPPTMHAEAAHHNINPLPFFNNMQTVNYT